MQNSESSSDESSSSGSTTSKKYKPEEPDHQMVIKPCCECRNCTYWTSSVDWCGKPDLEFEKKREKQEINKKFQPILKTAEHPGTPLKIVKYNYDNFTNIQKKSISRLFVHSPLTCPQPVKMVSETFFDDEMQIALRSLNYLYSLPLQSFVWPAIFRQMNVFMVNGKQSGKTMCYLPAMCSFAMQKHDRYPEFAKYKGPLVIILCPDSEQCGEIYDLAKKLMQNVPVSVHVSNVHSLMDIRKVDILITIPRVLIECIKARHVNLKRLCHLVVEGASSLLENHEDNLYTILKTCNEMLEHRNNSVKQVQVIVSSRKWTSKVEELMKNLFVTPVVCIGDQLEAALYGKIEFELHFSVSDEVRRKKKVVKEVKPQWAFLGDDIPEVYLSSGISPDEFYLRHAKFQPLLENLEKDIEIALKYDILDKEEDVIIGKYYLAPSPQKDKYSRALIINKENDKVLCFYVDYGDEGVVSLKSIRPLPPNLITKLPFQAIQCSLHGIQPVLPNGWDEKSTDILYEYMFEPNSDIFRSLYVKSVNSEKSNSLRGDFFYSILLKDGHGRQNTLINKILVDCGQAQLSNGEELDDFFLPNAQYVDGCDFEYDTDDFEIDEEEFYLEIMNPVATFAALFPEADSVLFNNQETGEEVVLLDRHNKLPEICSVAGVVVPDETPSDVSPPRTCSEDFETGSLTPEVWWSQTDTQIKLKIKLIDVASYKVEIKRNIVFTFWTELDERVYELKLTLFKLAKLDKHENKGQEVVITLSKVNPVQWDQLTATQKRMRNVHYEISDRDLKEKKKEPILSLGVADVGGEGDEDDGGLVYEIDDPDSDLELDPKAPESDEEF